MHFEESVTISAAPEKVFSLYADVADWATWDPDVKNATLDGAFIAGATGTLKPVNGPKAAITFTEVVPNRLFTVESRLPLCVMRFEHELSSSSPDQTTAVHRVRFSGILAPFFGRLIGNSLRKRLPHTLQGLKKAAESTV